MPWGECRDTRCATQSLEAFHVKTGATIGSPVVCQANKPAPPDSNGARPHESSERRDKRTPKPPPFSGINSIPATTNALIIFFPVSGRPPSNPSSASRRAIVGSDTAECSARSPCDHPNNARAAFTCLMVTEKCRFDRFSIDIHNNRIDIFSIDKFCRASPISRMEWHAEQLTKVREHLGQPDHNQAARSSDHG